MSALYTALVESETKESLAAMVVELRAELARLRPLAEHAEKIARAHHALAYLHDDDLIKEACWRVDDLMDELHIYWLSYDSPPGEPPVDTETPARAP